MEEEGIEISELIQLCAVDSWLFGRVFFPKTLRQDSPEFHREMDKRLDGPSRQVAFMIFRGGAKTTKVRVYMAKRISYAISRTILIVGKSQDHARRTVEWLMKQVEFNKFWSQTYGLQKGAKWTGEEIELWHSAAEVTIRIIALGITGSTRGINVDDYRPDLILVDDPCDEENTATEEQRSKTEDLLLGSLKNSLAPASESPLAKIVLLQTLLNKNDVISKCHEDPAWDSMAISVFKEDGTSSWPERWSTAELQREKESYIARGKLSLWMREMECKIVSGEMAAFRHERLRYWQVTPSLEDMHVFIAVDPVPPPSEREEANGLRDKDYEAWAAVGVWVDHVSKQKKIFLLETRKMRGHDPDWSIKTFFEMLDSWMPLKVKVESVAYQRTLKWLLEKAMMARGKFVPIDAHIPERRKKTYRIIDSIGSALGEAILYVHPSQSSVIQAIQEYPNVGHDDEIEAVAVAVQVALDWIAPTTGSGILEDESAYSDLPIAEACP